MPEEPTVDQLALAALAARCATETDNFFQRRHHDTRHCYELFRRAIVARDERAWAVIYQQYRTLVFSWVRRHPQFPLAREEAAYFVNRAFEKMWGALDARKFDNFERLGPLLRYLQMCAHSAIVDHTRRAELEALALDEELEGEGRLEGTVLDRLAQREFWALVRTRLTDEKEYHVVHASFVLGLKPREIAARYDTLYEDVREIYRLKESAMGRLRRDAALQEQLAAIG